MKQKYVIIIFFLGLFFIGYSNIAFGKEAIVEVLNNKAAEYTVQFTNKKAMISRDGSEAIPITSGTKLTKPGTYFLTLFDVKQGIQIKEFTIIAADKNSWTITRESELDEILKYALENFKKQIVIKFDYGNFSINELNVILHRHFENVVNQYPKLVFDGYSIVSNTGRNPSVQVRMEYPLQVTNNLKNFDAKTNKTLLQIINQNITTNMPDYKREAVLFQYVISHMTYSMTKSKGVNYVNATPMSHTMYGGLVNKVAVCDGYSKTLMYLLNAVGIPSKLVVGSSKDGVGHAWNLVQIQGAYYHVDSTWGDWDVSQIGGVYDFFNETDDYMKRTHNWDANLYPRAVSEAYSMVNIPISLPSVYKVLNSSQLTTMLSNLSSQRPKMASVIFYQDSFYKWDTEELTGRIVRSLGSGIRYNLERKYDCLIITFETE